MPQSFLEEFSTIGLEGVNENGEWNDNSDDEMSIYCMVLEMNVQPYLFQSQWCV